MKHVVLVFACLLTITQSLPFTILCEDSEKEHQRICWLDAEQLNARNTEESSFSFDYPTEQKRNSEISSALNMLYGRPNIKRNPELSSALMSYMRNSGYRN
ncbi:uncharacterized protein LOC130901422 [Diorhabda carinulata]|uniref:uncharacterized protein LOC130901422 n=1 Tax=Diorhabda carinulata TaxID=1163345 RepID=UPI0025A0D616|nr:uncharacterized protein LOC130901422 [Diorhabda carinulata]